MANRTKYNNLVRAAVLCALLCVLALVVVPIGPVPFSMAILGVALIGALLPPLWAAAALGSYLLLGLCGLPVFAGFNAGPGVLLGPTGGFLAGYFILALAVSFACKAKLAFPLQVLAGFGGMAGCYLLGSLWFVQVTGLGFAKALAVCVLPFAIPDFVKITLALLLARALQKRLAVHSA